MQFASEPGLLVALIEVAIGIALLAWAADHFVEGAASVASVARLSPVLVGAVIVGFGTSLPELLVSGLAATNGDLELGVGNIVGSNVANLSLVLGSAALIVPLFVTRAVLVREAPLSLLAVLLFAFLASGGLSRSDGVLLLIALVGALTWIIAGGVGGSDLVSANLPDGVVGNVGAELVRTVAGLVGTVLGAQLLVWGALGIADRFGMTGGFVGFTLVAVGTSLPELVTAVVAARKGATELILGNLLGSNIFNSLAVGGTISLVGPGAMNDEGLRTIGLVVMILISLTAWVFMVTLKRVHKFEGLVLLLGWLVAVILLARTSNEVAWLG